MLESLSLGKGVLSDTLKSSSASRGTATNTKEGPSKDISCSLDNALFSVRKLSLNLDDIEDDQIPYVVGNASRCSSNNDVHELNYNPHK